MTLRPLPRSRLGNLVPSLVQSQALVALVAATGDLRWAAEAAWDVARAAAQDGRRVALVDLWVEEPLLHAVKGLTPTNGIVDAFEYGVSLTKAAHEVDGVFFIAAGSSTAAPEFLLAHPRWKKLQAGFRAEGALLLVFLSAGALARLSAVPDGVIALAPEGLDLLSPAARGIVAAQEDGASLLGVVRERWTPSPMHAPADVAAPRPAPSPVLAPGRHRRRAGLAALGIAAGAMGGLAWLATARESFWATVREPPAAAAAPADRADTLPWTIQLAAYGTLDKALAQADQLAGEHVPAVVTPVALEGSGTVWYRVLAGAYPSRERAATERDRLWDDGVAPRGQGDLLRAPYTFALAGDAELERVRRQGIPAVRAPRGDRLMVGAFETPEQAAFTHDLLTRAGIAAPLVPRRETTP